MSKTLRNFSKKEKKTQQRRKTKGKKYGGNDSCTIGNNVPVSHLQPGDGPDCYIGDEPYNIIHKKQLVECFNKFAPNNSHKINLETPPNEINKTFLKIAQKEHPDKKQQFGEVVTEEDRNIFQNANNSNEFLTSGCIPSSSTSTYIHGPDSDDEREVNNINDLKRQKDQLEIANAIIKNISECEKEIPKPKPKEKKKLEGANHRGACA